MALAAIRQDGVAIVRLDGPRLDAVSSAAFKTDLKEMIDAGERHIILDFGNVQFMDSSGLGAVVGCLKYMAGQGELQIARPSQAVMKVLKLTRMDRVLKVRDLPPAP